MAAAGFPQITRVHLCWQTLTCFTITFALSKMKAVTINLSLNPDLADFARSESEAGAFDSMGEYRHELIRRRRDGKIAEDVARLQKAMTGAPAGDPSEADLRRIYTVAKKGRAK